MLAVDIDVRSGPCAGGSTIHGLPRREGLRRTLQNRIETVKTCALWDCDPSDRAHGSGRRSGYWGVYLGR
jgi:hypothetical protein